MIKYLYIPVLFLCWASLTSMKAMEPEDRIIRAWQLKDIYTVKQEVDIDTMINAFQIHNPVFSNSISNSYLGNAGLASMSNIFSDRNIYSDFFFIDHYRIYIHDSREMRYYNTKRPFSLIDFSTGGPREKNEKMLEIFHTQNVNPDFNLGFRYFNINSDGQYQNHRAVTNAISLFSSYEMGNYEFHANLGINSVRVFENGGLVNERSIDNEDIETEDHEVRLQNARNGISNNSFFLSQSWQPFLFQENDTSGNGGISWLARFKLYHILDYNRYRRTYQDNNPGSGFYENIYIDNNRTFDSVFYRNMTNSLMLQLPGYDRGRLRFDAKAGIRNELLKGSYNIEDDSVFIFGRPAIISALYDAPSDTIVKSRRERKHHSNAIIGTARGTAGEIFTIWGEGVYFFQGQRRGEYDIKAGLGFDFFEGKNRSVIEAGIQQREITPSMFFNSFASNHFKWDNGFKRMGESIIWGKIGMPERNLEAVAEFSLLSNHIFFDNTAHPRQHGDIIPVMNLSLKKNVQLWRFFLRNTIKYQVSGNREILPLPDVGLYHSLWYQQKFIRGIMNVQVGFDLYFTSGYQGNAWQPALSQFYLQNERMLGNYPFIDVFINVKHKRTRVFFKAEHLNAGQLPREYFTVLHYPRNEQMFKLGLSWSFYN